MGVVRDAASAAGVDPTLLALRQTHRALTPLGSYSFSRREAGVTISSGSTYWTLVHSGSPSVVVVVERVRWRLIGVTYSAGLSNPRLLAFQYQPTIYFPNNYAATMPRMRRSMPDPEANSFPGMLAGGGSVPFAPLAQEMAYLSGAGASVTLDVDFCRGGRDHALVLPVKCGLRLVCSNLGFSSAIFNTLISWSEYPSTYFQR